MSSDQQKLIILNEQNVASNFVRNGLITTLISLTILTSLITSDRFQSRTNYLILFKVIGIIFVLIAIWMFWTYSSISKQNNQKLKTDQPEFLIKNSHIVAFFLTFVLIIIIFLFIFA